MEDLEIVGDRGLEVVCSLGVVGSAGAISFFVFCCNAFAKMQAYWGKLETNWQ